MSVFFEKKALAAAIAALALGLSGCDSYGDPGEPGATGEQGDAGQDGSNGADGSNGLSSLIVQEELPQGNTQCVQGGVKVSSGLDLNADGSLSDDEVEQMSYVCAPTALNNDENFVRISSFLVCSQLEDNCNIDDETAAEIVDVSKDGMTLIYTDSPQEKLGFVDITNPANPEKAGTLSLSGEPTSVAVYGDYALVGVNTSQDFINTSGHLDVIDIANQTITTTIDLGGQPDSVAISPDGMYAAIAIENERDEDLGDGRVGQLPAGFLMVVDSSDADPANWTAEKVELTGLADIAPEDPEPEYVDINENNEAVISLQENNHIVIVDLATKAVTKDFSAGFVNLVDVDATEEDPAIIDQSESLNAVPREPDGLTWIDNTYFATADEGDMDGGSRGFTIFDMDGNVVYEAGSELEHLTARIGHYPDDRSGNKGNEPENAEVGIFGGNRYLFVNSERSSVIAVYDVSDANNPIYKQVLPAAAGPEGVKAIPSRNLVVAASEVDDRGDKLRSAINIYHLAVQESEYPTIASVNRDSGVPIPFSALSGLAADIEDADTIYAVDDSFYAMNRIFEIDLSEKPASLVAEMMIKDSDGIFAAFPTSGETEDADSFDAVDLSNMINDDNTVNIDGEGIAMSADGGFWIASEGAGTFDDTSNRPIEKLNFLFKTDAEGIIEDVITLPDDVNAIQLRFGFEGVAEYDDKAYVAFQRAWSDEANPRIGIYNPVSESWEFVFYPLDERESQDGGWVGLSDITSLGDGSFYVLERDNKGGPDAAIKRIYKIDLSSFVAGETISKTLVKDLMADLKAPGGLGFEKVEGMALTVDGELYIVNDNDGVDDNSGEIQLLNIDL